MLRQFQSSNVFLWGIVLISCVCSRLVSTIYYIEDIDSLRFALSMVDYDVAKLQPHFPAYLVFCFTAKLLYILMGRYALAFSLIGGVSVTCIIYFTLKIAKIEGSTILGKIVILVIFLNPLLWLMSNRYMPDTMGVACLLASLYFTMAQDQNEGKSLLCRISVGYFLAGILLGVRLSYFPLLMPLLLGQLKGPKRFTYIIAGVLGVLIWFIPLLLVTDWDSLIDAAQKQSHGHFLEFGGTISTHPTFWLRATKIIESLWADGFGLYWSGRHFITACTSITLIVIIIISYWHMVRLWFKEKRNRVKKLLLNPVFLGCILYLIWIFFAQNVIHKSRHVLPLLPFISLGIALSCHRIAMKQGAVAQTNRKRNNIGFMFSMGIVVVFFISYSYVTIHTVVQHTKPTAIAQIHNYLHNKLREQDEKFHVVSVPLIKYYLSSQALEAEFIVIKSDVDFAQLDEIDSDIVVIGSPLPDRVAKVEKVFYHNPYVNRMWSEISLYEY